MSPTADHRIHHPMIIGWQWRDRPGPAGRPGPPDPPGRSPYAGPPGVRLGRARRRPYPVDSAPGRAPLRPGPDPVTVQGRGGD
eukprot:149197-Hanusia_phi.AAC.6